MHFYFCVKSCLTSNVVIDLRARSTISISIISKGLFLFLVYDLEQFKKTAEASKGNIDSQMHITPVEVPKVRLKLIFLLPRGFQLAILRERKIDCLPNISRNWKPSGFLMGIN